MRILILVLVFSLIASQYVAIETYNKDLALELTYYSFAAYCSAARLQKWDISVTSQKYPAMKDVKVISAKGLQAYVGFNPTHNAVTVSFRGTSNLQNWITNIDVKKTTFYPQCNCKVHAGFYANYVDLKNAGLIEIIIAQINKYPGSQTHVTGHSLGAVLATMLVAELYIQAIPVSVFMTIGSPRLGDADFWNWFENLKAQDTMQSFRITHGYDPVPHLPPQLMGFYHINTEVFYNEDPKICKNDFGEDPSCINGQNFVKSQVSSHLNYLGVDQQALSNDCQ